MTSHVMPLPAPRHAVLWATPRAAADLPVAADLPAALLPLGGSTVIEGLVQALAQLGVRRIDLVVCDRPEGLRQRLGQGERWGVEIRWHLARDPHQAGGFLRHLDTTEGGAIILGQVDRWISAPTLVRLATQGGSALVLDRQGAPVWSGWACVPGGTNLAELAGCDEAGLGRQMAGAAYRPWLAGAEQIVTLDARGLLAVQQQLHELAQPPVHWRPMPWGAMSPHAHVHPGAQLTGPVWIGPGCVVGERARVGPHVLLAEDVVVASAAQLTHCTVMPSSYIGPGLELRRAVVDGTQVRHVDLGIDTVMPRSEGLLLSLQAGPLRRPGPAGRLLAMLVVMPLLGLLPITLAVALFGRLRRPGRQQPWWPWARRTAVVGHDEHHQRLQVGPLRCRHDGGSGLRRLVGLSGELLDIVQGRRCWFGVRPRTTSEWYALSAEWQLLLREAPIGLLHAPAWDEDEFALSEAVAAADVHYAARPGVARNVGVALALLQGALHIGARHTAGTTWPAQPRRRADADAGLQRSRG
ncbi:MAG: hypothetical protein RL375_2015 [Pseudomonadota bacterium]